MIRSIINNQIKLSKAFDKILPEKYIIDGNKDFLYNFAPRYLRDGLVIYDIGGGKNPYIGVDQKILLNIKVVGLDISQQELDRAPTGAYDKTICADITQYRGNEDADLIVCQALLEHVKDTEQAFESLVSILKPGGIALIFVPSRNAVFARLNILLPQALKRKILNTIYPHTQRNQGFPSYYNKCTPYDFRRLAKRYGLEIKEEKFYFVSSYFSFFLPFYLIWRLWILSFHLIRREQAAETFSVALIRAGNISPKYQQSNTL